MSDSIFCLSTDTQFSESVKSRFCSDSEVAVVFEVFAEAKTANQRLSEIPFSTVFVDFRADSQVDSLDTFFESLWANELGRVDLIAVTDGSLPPGTTGMDVDRSAADWDRDAERWVESPDVPPAVARSEHSRRIEEYEAAKQQAWGCNCPSCLERKQ